ncbi:MAG: hypothetical protein VX000_02875, partial [Myxococcota bacterium]|nr:hypothetical protein [Myxococcota bacterium]
MPQFALVHKAATYEVRKYGPSVIAECSYGGQWGGSGDGAPFGPDGTGAEAAVHLGGHLYPLHVFLIGMAGDGRTLSVIAGTLTCALLWLYCRRLGLGSTGGWMAAALPLAVYPSCLTAGDAPALLFVVAGATLATLGRGAAVLGGALALSAIAVKPVVLPGLVLLLPRPVALVGVALGLPAALPWLKPLTNPKADGGLLGTWWQAGGGTPPDSPAAVSAQLLGGLEALGAAPAWTLVPLAGIAAVGALWPRAARREGAEPAHRDRVGVIAAIIGLVLVAALFGERLAPRYLMASMVALLPWAGALLPRWSAALLVFPTAALLTQVAAHRSEADPTADVPTLPVLPLPVVDAGPLFDESSTEGATALRAKAAELATSLP